MKPALLPLMVALLALLLATCEKPERNNPWDEKASLAPDAWAPQNFRIEDVTITEKKLTWTFDDKNIEGFKLDRKKGDEPWQVAYQTFAKETRSFTDQEIIPETGLTYQYRLYTFAGKNKSAEKAASVAIDFPPPTDLQLEKLSDISYKLTWQDNSTGEEGFKIDRKAIDNVWVIGYGTVGANETSFVDTNVFIGKSSFNVEYRVYAIYNEFESAKTIENTTAALTPPTDLTIIKNTITTVTLNWQDNSNGEQGFNIERKYATGDWVEVATTTGTSWQDNDFELNTMVYYRVNAYYNQYSSTWAENSFDATIPPPENLSITANSATSVTLNWNYSLTGHEGFKIERKIDNGSWEMMADNLNVNHRSFNDNGIDLNNYTYHYRVFAYFAGYNSSKPEQSITFMFTCGANFTDERDGSQYETVQIGNQCWIKENLKWLPSVSPSANGSNSDPYFYVYGYQGVSVLAAKATTDYQTYGVLYNWSAALNACPDGWHLPADNEWTVLVDYLGGSSVAGGKMKTTGTTHWYSPNKGATNSSGFSGLPGGYRYGSGNFSYLGGNGYWWSSTQNTSPYAWYHYLHYNNADIYRYNTNKELGFSVRCVRD